MTPYEFIDTLLATTSNSIFEILDALSKFDIRQIDPQKIAMLGQLFADSGRVVVDLARSVSVLRCIGHISRRSSLSALLFTDKGGILSGPLLLKLAEALKTRGAGLYTGDSFVDHLANIFAGLRSAREGRSIHQRAGDLPRGRKREARRDLVIP